MLVPEAWVQRRQKKMRRIRCEPNQTRNEDEGHDAKRPTTALEDAIGPQQINELRLSRLPQRTRECLQTCVGFAGTAVCGVQSNRECLPS
jgi:uncharacterized protein (DUF2267 family)